METEDGGTLDSCSSKNEGRFRAEIDTSAPFESVKEAVGRFGGVGFWKPSHSNFVESENDAIDLDKLKNQSSSLKKDLMLKESETLGVLKELESTKMIIAELELKLRLQEPGVGLKIGVNTEFGYMESEAEKENQSYLRVQSYNSEINLSSLPLSPPELILKELKQAKVNLMRTTHDIAGVRSSIDFFNAKLEEGRISLEKTRERLTQNSSKVSSLMEELNQTTTKLQIAREASENCGSDGHSNDRQRLCSKIEQFQKMGLAAKSQATSTISLIESAKDKIKTVEIRLIAARKIKEAARAAETGALAEIKVLTNHDRSSEHSSLGKGYITLSRHEYSSLTSKALEVEKVSKKRVEEAMKHVDEANVSNNDTLKRVEEATEEVKTTKRALESALNRVEAAHKGRIAVEEALRQWRSDYGHKRNSLHNSTKFKNSGAANHSQLDKYRPVSKPTMSIGQILAQKLLFPNEFDEALIAEKASIKLRMSLGQLLSKQNSDVDEAESDYPPKPFIGKKRKLNLRPHRYREFTLFQHLIHLLPCK